MGKFWGYGLWLVLAFAAGPAAAQSIAFEAPLPSPEQQIRDAEAQMAPPVGGLTSDETVKLQYQRLEAPIQLESKEVLIEDIALRCIGCGSTRPGAAAPSPEIPVENLRARLLARRAADGEPAPLLKRRIKLKEAFEILKEIDDAYREAGYVFVTTIADVQDIDPAGHVLKLTVVESRLGDVIFSFDQPSRLNPDAPPPVPAVASLMRDIARSYVDLSGENGPIRLGRVEKLLLLLNDIPGVERAIATPRGRTNADWIESQGENAAGVIDLYIDVAFKRYAGVVFGDTRQSPVLGPGVIGVKAEGRSLAVAGDAASALYIGSVGGDDGDFKERNSIQLDYAVPVNANGTRLDLRGAYTRSRPGEKLAALDVSGATYVAELGLEHPLLRTRAASVWGRVGLTISDEKTTMAEGALMLSRDRSRVASVGARFSIRHPALLYAQGDIEYRQGLDMLDASKKGDADLSRFDGDPTAGLVRVSAETEALIPLEHPFFKKRLSAYLSAAAQYAFSPLLSAEEFSIGGAQTVRGYDPGELKGDHGWRASFELRHRSELGEVPSLVGGPAVPVAGVAYGFVDAGEVHNLGAGSPKRQSLMSFGVGFRLQMADSSELNLEIAKPTSLLARTRDDGVRASVSFVHRF